MSFGVTFYVAKYEYSIGSVQSLYFRFCKKDGRNIFLFLEKKMQKEIN